MPAGLCQVSAAATQEGWSPEQVGETTREPGARAGEAQDGVRAGAPREGPGSRTTRERAGKMGGVGRGGHLSPR